MSPGSADSADIEQRLAAAAQAVREREVISQRQADLRARQGELETELAALREQASAERTDVERLEGMSLARVLAALAGAREERLARERAEADAAGYRAAEAAARLEAVRREVAAAGDRLAALEPAPRAYAAVLDEKERYLTGSGDRRGAALLALADEQGRLMAELKETVEAVRAADAATAAMSDVADMLSDLAVADRIRQAQQQVTDSAEIVERLRGRLTARARAAQGRLAAIEAERERLLTV